MSVAYIRKRGSINFESGRPWYDYDQMTKGQFRALLAAEQLQMMGVYSGNQTQLDAAQCIWNAVGDGLHDHLPTTGLPEADAIIRACRNMKKAAVKGAKISGIIELMDCEEMAEQAAQIAIQELSDATGTDTSNWNWSGGYPETLGQEVYADAYNAQMRLCRKENYYKDLLNQQIDKFGHHLLYAYDESLSTAPPVVATKGTSHRLAISRLSDISGLDIEDIRAWINTGIMRANNREGIPPMHPDQTIAEFAKANGAGVTEQTAGLSGPRIGEPIATITIIIGIIKAVVAAVSATAMLIQAMKLSDRQRFEQSINQIGLPEFGPRTDDWPGGDWGEGSGGNEGGGQGNFLDGIDPMMVALLGLGVALVGNSGR